MAMAKSSPCQGRPIKVRNVVSSPLSAVPTMNSASGLLPRNFLLLLGLGFLTFSRVPAAAATPKENAFILNDGDTMAFVGDSITHQCLYTQYLEDFFYTRFPERRIRFHNAGVGGDSAADVLARFEDEVAPLKPKYVTVLLGMNDGRYEDFKPEIFAAYAAGVQQTLDRIKAIGATPILLSPTSNEMLRVSGLAPGSYEIKIDGRSLGKPIAHTTLSAKIELQANENTPQYQQALQVALLNRERNDQAVRPLRDIRAKIKGARNKFRGDTARFAEFMQTTQPEIDRLVKLAGDYEDRIHNAAQPVARHYEITLVTPAARPTPKNKQR